MKYLYLFNDIHLTFQVTSFILSIGLLIASLEDLKEWPQFSDSGLLGWKVGRWGTLRKSEGSVAKLANFLLSEKTFKTSIFLRIVGSATLLLFSVINIVSPFLILCLFALTLLLALRSPYGLDGAYQMNLVTLLALSISSIAGVNSEVSVVCMIFICSELILSYFIAGFFKLISPIWRKSYALPVIFSTRTYGNAFIYEFVRNHSLITSVLTWSVFIFEMSFFCIFFASPLYVPLICILGIIFHLFNSIFMGLNSFLFGFVATYPALLYCLNQFGSKP